MSLNEPDHRRLIIPPPNHGCVTRLKSQRKVERIKSKLMANCWHVFQPIVFLLPSRSRSVCESLMAACFHSAAVRFLRRPHNAQICGLLSFRGDPFSVCRLCRFGLHPWQPTCAISAPCGAGVNKTRRRSPLCICWDVWESVCWR